MPRRTMRPPTPQGVADEPDASSATATRQRVGGHARACSRTGRRTARQPADRARCELARSASGRLPGLPLGRGRIRIRPACPARAARPSARGAARPVGQDRGGARSRIGDVGRGGPAADRPGLALRSGARGPVGDRRHRRRDGRKRPVGCLQPRSGDRRRSRREHAGHRHRVRPAPRTDTVAGDRRAGPLGRDLARWRSCLQPDQCAAGLSGRSPARLRPGPGQRLAERRYQDPAEVDLAVARREPGGRGRDQRPG